MPASRFEQLCLVVLACLSAAIARAELPNGVASGDVNQNSAVLWARSTSTGPLRFDYSTDPTFANFTTLSGTVVDPLIPAKVDVSGLSPGTRYYYRATDAAAAASSGTFKTAAPPDVRAGLRFAAAADWRGELRPYPALSNLPGRNLDFLIALGDTVYADVPSPELSVPARSVDEFRRKNHEVYSARFGVNTLAAVRASTPILATIDDHEVINNFAGGAPPSSDPRFLPSAELFINDTPLYDNGLQAFQEYNPLGDEFYGATLDPRTAGERKLYRANRYGSDAGVFVLDNRSFRDQELPAVTNPTDPAQVGAFLAASYAPGRTMLGAVQLADLKADLLAAQAQGVTWKFVVTPEPIQQLGPLEANDRWEGYHAERTELMSFIHNNSLDNVVFVAADLHGLIVNNLTYAAAPQAPQIATRSFEIVVPAAGYDEVLGPEAIRILTQLGQLTPEQINTYYSLSKSGKDAFIRSIGQSAQQALGYDTVGLEGSPIPATLLAGSYFAAHDIGWTEFDIDPASQALTVTTYGIDPYTQAQIESDPAAILARTPVVISRFAVQAIVSSAWNVDAHGDWSQGSNWSGGVPNTTGARARFGSRITQPRTVTVDVPITVREIEFDHTTAYTIAGSNPITLDVAAGNAQITVNSGSHTISAPLTLADNTVINVVPAGSNLSLTGPLDAGTASLTKAGAGRLTMNNLQATGLAVNGGTVAIAPNGTSAGTSVVSSLTIAGMTNNWTATVDFNNNDAVVRSTAATKADDIARLYNQLKQGFASGTWTGQGITSSTAGAASGTGLSVVDNAQLELSSFSGQTVNNDSILLKYTYYGDIDVNGQVDADDLTVFANNFGRATGAMQIDGDIDFDGDVDADDLTVFANNFGRGIGNSLAAGAVAAIPEPASLVLAAVGAGGVLSTLGMTRRRRQGITTACR